MLFFETTALAGHVKDNLPVKSNEGSVLKSISETPPPSLPGNQAATNESELLISVFAHIGRPDKNTDTIGIPFSL